MKEFPKQLITQSKSKAKHWLQLKPEMAQDIPGLHRAGEAGPEPPLRSAASCFLAAPAEAGTGTVGAMVRTGKKSALLRQAIFARVFLIKEQEEKSALLRQAIFARVFLIQEQEEGFIPQQMAGPHSCFPSEGEIHMVTAGASPSPVFSPSHCSVHTVPLFPFKPPLHQLFAWGDISGKCEEMAAEPKP